MVKGLPETAIYERERDRDGVPRWKEILLGLNLWLYTLCKGKLMEALSKEECPKEGLNSENHCLLVFIVSTRGKSLPKVSFGQRARDTENQSVSKRQASAAIH